MPVNIEDSLIYPVQEGHFKLVGDTGTYQIVNTSSDWILSVNDIAAMIWQLCTHEYSVEDMINVLADVYAQPVQSIEEGIQEILQQFRNNNIIRFDLDQYPSGTFVESGVTYHEIPRSLFNLLEQLRSLVEEHFPAKAQFEKRPVDQDSLTSLMEQGAARSTSGKHLDLKFLSKHDVHNQIDRIGKELDNFFPPLDVPRHTSGHMLYGGNSWMGWHTNEDLPGRRIYCNWSEKDNENDFRYLDPETGEMIIQPEPAGWSMKSFYIPTPPHQLWHAINAGGKRIALGFAEYRYKKIDSLQAKVAA